MSASAKQLLVASRTFVFFDMLRSSSLVKVLDQVKGEGVKGAILLNREGTLLAYSGLDEKPARMTAAIASNVWTYYDRTGRSVMNEDPLTRFTMKCVGGYITVSAVSSLLLCIQSESDVHLGSLLAKMDALRTALKEPLDRVSNI